MLLWCDGPHDPAENMRRDMILLGEAEQGAPATLRLFAFQPHGITLGASQTPEKVLDLERCERDGVPWAVRPTGGRAIFHAEEWTYSLACAIDDPAWGGSLAVAYARVTALLVQTLRRLGVPAEAGPRPGARDDGTRRDPVAPCFMSTARHEVTVGGRKLVGSAQRRTAHGLLQQGSVLLGDSHSRLADYLRIDDGRREAIRDGLARASTHAGRWIEPEASLERWAAAWREVLGPRVRTIDAADVPHRLTLAESRSYTSAHSQLQR